KIRGEIGGHGKIRVRQLPLQQRLAEDRGLRGPPAVNGLLRDLRLGGESFDGHALVSARGERATHGRQDGLTGLLAARTGHHPRVSRSRLCRKWTHRCETDLAPAPREGETMALTAHSTIGEWMND